MAGRCRYTLVEEETLVVPIWITLPELPWHCYYKDTLTPMLSPIGKALKHLDMFGWDFLKKIQLGESGKLLNMKRCYHTVFTIYNRVTLWEHAL
ncbi:hypothetical protein H5410_046413 [Solanum commersonii]|uniref:DUF4283 domain-containing protein n=1 Tax=Solanum commersonii TaxID=4109 RepID=A0A9J5XC70_SOLCO|nr:hypothetical protein H5410_046413 [Solanum commersonii]